MSLAFIPKSLANQIANLPVSSIFACAYDPTAVSGPSGSASSQKTNHWVLFLAISRTESLRLDPSPDSNNNLTLIVSKSYLGSKNAVKTVQLYTVENLTVGNIFEYLRSSNYIQYQFSTGGQGCRYWIDSVIVLLWTAKYITDDLQVEEARAALQVVWDIHGKAGGGEQTGIIAGKFY